MINKKADIAVTILVMGIIALCILTLISFSLASSKQIKGVVRSAYLLEDAYSIADSIRHSGSSHLNDYKSEFSDYNINSVENKIIIEKTYFKDKLFSGKGEEIIKVKYSFVP